MTDKHYLKGGQKMEKWKCIKSFSVTVYDENENIIEDEWEGSF